MTKSFKATLERSSSRLNWVIVRIPFDAAKVWGKRGQVKVKGEINGFPFRTSLFPNGKGEHSLLVNKKMQAGAKAGPGSVAQFRLELDTEERVVTIPPELKRALSEDRALVRWYGQLNYSMRKYISDLVTDVKSPEARERRANQMAERLLATMDGERELPPILRIAFAGNPQAYEGWQRMSPTHRRQHLFGIVSYRDPASQARRVAKMMREIKPAT